MDLEKLIENLPANEYEQFMAQVMEYRSAVEREQAQESFMSYVKMMWPGFVHGRHHALMAKKFEDIATGKIKRAIINMPPRHTKSEFASYLLPSWFLGKFPAKKIIQCSNTGELAVGFGRKVRNLVDSQSYSKVFPDVNLRHDSKAAGRWATNKGGEYFAIGVGGTVTGKGADLLIIDDPHSEQEAAAAAGNPEVYDKVYEWYTSGPRQRLQPGGSIVIVMCMTGDTNVLMSDGTQKQLKDIRLGDMVATFDKGKLAVSRVNNWQSSGVDSIYKIQTQSGKILRANERHPFLVFNEGVMEWTRLKDLMPGMLLVATKDARAQQDHKRNPENAQLAKQGKATTEKTQTHFTTQSATTESGKDNNASAEDPLSPKDYAAPATTNNSHQQNLPQNKTGLGASSIGMELPPKTLYEWLTSAVTNATCAAKSLLQKIQGRTGMANFASTTAMKPEKSGDYSAMTVTSPLGTERRRAFLNKLHRISDFTVDQIVSITPDGQKEVFDVEIDRTENFIANGVVSHNTRWAENDLTGRVLKDSLAREKGENWELIELPAIMPSGKPLWPEFWSIEELEALKDELPPSKWNAQYQQNPTGEEGALIKREWWKVWEPENPPACAFIIQSWDTAFTKSERSDPSACTTWGVFYKDENENDPNLILLDAFQKRMEFPELKEKAFAHYKEWEPDAFIVEAKASGLPLIFELRQMGIPVSEYSPSRGNDKFVRVNSVSDLFASGKVWAPDTRWAHEVIEQMAAFPNAAHDDLVDSSTQALIRFRQGGFLRLDSDEQEEIRSFRRKHSYY
jgi:predicted phage terminase large subunit-like protein